MPHLTSHAKFYRGTLEEYAAAKQLKTLDPDGIYFCTTNSGFCIFFGDSVLELYNA